jgi:mannose-6-phosphate isomerase-like protein (cupin superfamily)
MLIKKNQARLVNQGSKIIRGYASSDRQIEINHMILNGRTPAKEGTFLCETKVHFMAFVIKGEGKMYCGDEVYNVGEGDALDVPANTRFGAEGNMEYVTAEHPAWYKEQATIVDKNGDIIK